MEGFGPRLSNPQHRCHPFQSPLMIAIWPNHFLLAQSQKPSYHTAPRIHLPVSQNHHTSWSLLAIPGLTPSWAMLNSCFVHNHPEHCIYQSYFHALSHTTYIVTMGNFYLLSWLFHCPNFCFLYSSSSTFNLSHLILFHRSFRLYL